MTNLTNLVFETVEVDNSLDCPVRKVLKIPEARGEESLGNFTALGELLCKYILHMIADGEAKLEELRDYVILKPGISKKLADNVLKNSYKPGQTKKGFGPFYVSTLLETVSEKGDDNVLRILKTIFVVASLRPFIRIEGLQEVCFVPDKVERIVELDKMTEICQAAAILQKFLITVDLMTKVRLQEGFFHIEEWQIHLKSFRNRLLANLDAIEAFSDAADLVSCLTVAHYLRLNNKFMLANSDLLTSDNAYMLLETEQFFSLGLQSLPALPTLLGKEMTSEMLSFSFQSVLSPIITSNLLILSDLEFRNEVIYSYKDFALNQSIRGAAILKTCFLEHPIASLRQMDGAFSLFSHSTEYIEQIGKSFSEVLASVLAVSSMADFDNLAERADFAIKGYHSNLSEQELRLLILSQDSSMVRINIPFEVEMLTDDFTAMDEFKEISYVYRKEINRSNLEFEDITAFRITDELFLRHPFITALSKIHSESIKFRKIAYQRDKSFFPKYSYSKLYILEAKDFSITNEKEIKDYVISSDNFSFEFSADLRKLCGIASQGTYSLNCKEFRDRLELREPLFKKMEELLGESFTDIYSDYDRIKIMQCDQEFKRVAEGIKNNLFLKKIGAKVYAHAIENLINSDGKVNQNISSGELNNAINQGIIDLINDIGTYILGKEEIVYVNQNVLESTQFSFLPLSGRNSENI